jgi:hypothetical protein
MILMKKNIASFVFLLFVLSGCRDTDNREVVALLDGRIATIRQDIKQGNYTQAESLIEKTLIFQGKYPQIDTLRMLKASIDSLKNIERIRRSVDVAPLKKRMRIEVDDMQGYQYYNPISSPKYVNRNGFYPFIKMTKDSSLSMWLRIQYYADDWLFIQKYVIKADTTVFTLYPNRAMNTDVGDGGMIWEYTTIPATGETLDMLKAVAKCKKAKIRFVGRQYHKEKDITQEQKQAITDVIDLFDAMQ